MIHVQMKNLIDNIRGKMDAKKYQDYIIGLMFYKFMSDNNRVKTKIEDWQKLDDVRRSFKEVEEDYPNIFENVELDSKRFGASEEERYKNISLILDSLRDVKSDAKIFGDVYEWLIAEFSSYDAKKGGEFYTPKEISHLLAKIVAGDNIKSVYDPTCGTGSLLLEVNKELKENATLYGQEINPTSYNLCRMGMISSGEDNAQIYNADTLKGDTFEENKRFDAIVSNPPYSLKNWNTNELDSTHYYFKNGVVPPKSKGDMAFILHSFHHLSDHGKMAIVLPPGILYRGGAEGKIRTYLTPYIESVIMLPSNIFTNTTITTCVIVMSKKETDDILFIDASNEFKKESKINVFTGTDKVIDVLKNKKEIERFSRVVSLNEIKDNDYSLSLTSYIDTFEPKEPINIEELHNEIAERSKRRREIEENLIILEKEILQIFLDMEDVVEDKELLAFARKVLEEGDIC